MISWSVSVGSRRRSASVRASVAVSARITKAIPAAATTSVPTSCQLTSGRVGDGNPDGIGPTTETPCWVRSSALVTTIEPTTATRIPGTFGIARRKTRITASDAIPIDNAAPTVLPSRTPSTNARASSTKPSALVLKPKSRGSCPTRTTSAMPFRKPVRTGFERSSARMPRRANPATTQNAPMRSASIPASATALVGSPLAPTSGRIDAAMSGPNAESGPSKRIRDGPNIAYAVERDDCRVEAGHRRETCKFGVGHALGHEHGHQHDSRDQVHARAIRVGSGAPTAVPEDAARRRPERPSDHGFRTSDRLSRVVPRASTRPARAVSMAWPPAR